MNKNPAIKVVVLYSSGHLGSCLLLNKVLKMPCYEVVGIVQAQVLDRSLTNYTKLRKKYDQLGFLLALMLVWQRIIQNLCFVLAWCLPLGRKTLRTSTQIAKDVPLYECGSINSPEALEFISECQADLLISAYFPQILKKDALQSTKLGVLNVHPGWLPAYKGAMSYFHVLAQGAEKGGVSVHWMDEGIDTGQLLSRRSFVIKAKMTQESVMVKTAVIGASLLKRLGTKLRRGEALDGVSLGNEVGQYFSMPSKKDFERYQQRYRFFRVRDIFGLIVLRPWRR